MRAPPGSLPFIVSPQKPQLRQPQQGRGQHRGESSRRTSQAGRCRDKGCGRRDGRCLQSERRRSGRRWNCQFGAGDCICFEPTRCRYRKRPRLREWRA